MWRHRSYGWDSGNGHFRIDGRCDSRSCFASKSRPNNRGREYSSSKCRLLAAIPSLSTRTAPTTAYAAGLRASETVGLKVANIDSSRMLIRSSTARAARISMSCCRCSCSRFCDPGVPQLIFIAKVPLGERRQPAVTLSSSAPPRAQRKRRPLFPCSYLLGRSPYQERHGCPCISPEETSG
jgi:hypothetical protein